MIDRGCIFSSGADLIRVPLLSYVVSGPGSGSFLPDAVRRLTSVKVNEAGWYHAM